MSELLFKYYGVDWLGTLLMIVFLISIGSKKREGFLFGIVGNAVWLVFGIQTESIASIVACSIQFFLNLRAYFLWKQPELMSSMPIVSAPDIKEDLQVQSLQKQQWHHSISVN